VVELIPRSFEELRLEDVADVIARIGEERENLFFERKASVSGNSLAKACAAFANTFGGLLVIGVEDADDALTGIEAPGAEPQLWVKDTLRGLVLPMPPFRARWLPTGEGRGLLLVLIEWSATTPHLLTRTGAIYVRSPGSSDPVPLGDQRRLLDLTARGESADARARANVESALHFVPSDEQPGFQVTEWFALAPTGVAADFEARLFARDTPDDLSVRMWGDWEERTMEHRPAAWGQDYVGARRLSYSRFRSDPTHHQAIVLNRSGVLTAYKGISDGADDDRDDALALSETQVRTRFNVWLSVARDVLAEYGGHGDLYLAYELVVRSRGMHFDSVANGKIVKFPRPVTVQLQTTFEASHVDARVFAEIHRAGGFGPRDD
jgi:hypothetical protein